jgi:D-glycero-D-manno-heptose 1,7-bisphosphate phosphatase
MKPRAVFLDRDGVLNRAMVRDGKPYPPADAGELEMLPGVASACGRLRDAGYLLIGVTNQPDVARGTTSHEDVEALNRIVARSAGLHEIRACLHDDTNRCECRKPRPGLLLQAAADHGIDLDASFMVGDRWRDVEAGRRAGCRTIFIDHGYAERRPDAPDFIARSLSEAAALILSHTDRGEGNA